MVLRKLVQRGYIKSLRKMDARPPLLAAAGYLSTAQGAYGSSSALMVAWCVLFLLMSVTGTTDHPSLLFLLCSNCYLELAH